MLYVCLSSLPLYTMCLLDFGNVPTVWYLLLIFGNKRFQQDGFNRTSSNKLLFIGNCMMSSVSKNGPILKPQALYSTISDLILNLYVNHQQ